MTTEAETGPLFPRGLMPEATDFLMSMAPNGPWHLCAIVPDGSLTARTFDASESEAMAQFLFDRNGRENIYHHVNPLRDNVRNKKASKADVACAHWVYVDIDDLEAFERISAFSIPPTVVVCSGGGYNVYWRMTEPLFDLERAERINRWLVDQLGGDRAATDSCRILRTAFTINLPTNTKRARGRTETAAYLVDDAMDWSRQYDPSAFGEVESSTSVGLVANDVAEVTAQDLPDNLPKWLSDLIVAGDDLDRPRGTSNQHYKSRSEALFAAACGMLKHGVSDEVAAGVVSNRAYRISESILEKLVPASEARRQVAKARMKVMQGWPDGVTKRSGVPQKTFQNTQAALLRLGVVFHFDQFRRRMFAAGKVVQAIGAEGELSDRICNMLRDVVNKEFGFDPGKENTRDAIEQLCNGNPVDPVCEYLNSVKWDGVPRIDTWLTKYAGAEDNAYVRAVGAIVLIAAARRPRKPGVKFDTIAVLEGPQGSGKSTLIRILASEAFFSDQDLLALDAKAQIEALEGVWIYELGELAGMRRADVNKVKSFVSRMEDRARMAYARISEPRPRRGILIGTTNDDQYLQDPTGNRRFWPVPTRQIDLDGLRADRDQLWAEAAAREALGESIELPANLRPFAATEQQKRVAFDPWEDILAGVSGTLANDREIVLTNTIRELLLLSPERLTPSHYKRIARIMGALGWTGPVTLRQPVGRSAKGYWRPISRSIQSDVI